MTTLRTKPGRDPNRRAHQAQVKRAIMGGQAWGLAYLLAKLRDRDPYDNYSVPDDLAVFEFTLKGVLRLEMMDKPQYAGWRRMFGSNTKAHEMRTWRSRVALRAFANSAAALDYVRADPLWSWGITAPPEARGRPDDDWHVVFQVQDVWIARGRWSELLDKFLSEESRVLELVGRFEPLPPAQGGRHA
jgi:hypothetical protein